MKKKILILGNSAKEYALAKYLSKECEIFAAPGNDGIKEFATCVDLRETSAHEILEFVMENGIDMTIPVSNLSLNTNIVQLFENNNLQIFAPNTNAAKLILDKNYAKKLLYKLKIPTPKFGIFEKQSMAADYIKNINGPYVIKTNEPSSAIILTNTKSSKNILDSIFTKNSQKVLIEDYVYGEPFSFYSITDGYKALPIGSSLLYKHSLEGNGGQLTTGMGSCVPNYKLSYADEDYLMNNVIYPTLEYLNNGGNSYKGILGVNGILSENGNISILGYQPFMQDSDCAGILGLLDTDLYKLFESCCISSFSDEYESVHIKDYSATSVVLSCRNSYNKENIISGLDNLDDDTDISMFNNIHKNKYLEYEANNGLIAVITAYASTVSSSTRKAYNQIKHINFTGLKYRTDICKPVNTAFQDMC